MIIADTCAVVALVDAADRHHRAIRDAFEQSSEEWLLPWAILPEVDYLLGAHVGPRAQDAFVQDLAESAFTIEWGRDEDLQTARAILTKYPRLRLGLVDATVMAIAVRRGARAIATLDLRHFGSVALPGSPLLIPRDAVPRGRPLRAR